MNMKKIVAGAVASVMAVSTLAIGASAKQASNIEALKVNDGMLKIAIIGDEAPAEFADVTFTDVAGVSVVATYELGEGEWVGGSVVFTSETAGWKQTDWTSDETATKQVVLKSGVKTTFKHDASPYAASDTYAVIAIQDFSADGPVVTFEYMELLDKDGNVLASVGTMPAADATDAPAADATDAPAADATDAPAADATDAPAADATDAPAADATDAPAVTPDKNQPDTGVEGVAVVAGLAVLATGAIVIAKKRK